MKGFIRFLWVFAALATVIAFTVYEYPLWITDQMLRFHMRQQGIHSGWIAVSEGRLHVYEAEAPGGGGTPLLLIHGLGGRGEDFASLMPKLAAEGFHVYVPDLLGYGQSDKPESSDFSIHTQAHILTEFMDAEHLAHADVVGWSMGGWIALRLAADNPLRVSRLVLYDSAGITFNTNLDAAFFSPTDEAGVTRLVRAMSPTMKAPPPFIERALVRKMSTRAWVVARSMRAMRTGQDLVDTQLPNLQQPMFIVWGSDDAVTPLSVGEAMHRMNPRSAFMVVDGCGHFAPVECSAPIAKATVNFLRAEPPVSGSVWHVPRQERAKVPQANKGDAN